MPNLPSGTVTFLFTDIEGSTRLFEHHPDATWYALERHHVLLREAITTHGGHAFKTIGDAIQAAFPTAAEALAAAVAAQAALAAESWEQEIGALRVRMAIHTGTAEPVVGDYMAPCLNRLARLLAAGFGGQTLLTLAAHELVKGHLPKGVSLRDLGKHRLRDLLAAEHVWQVVVPGLPDHFPPLKSLERHPTNLPVQSTQLIGREAKVAAVGGLLRSPDVRLVTLTGVGGVGKTHLAMQAGSELLDDFEDGVFVVELAPVSDPELVIAAVARTLGVREAGDQSLFDGLAEYLADRQLLLLLDNFEHVVSAAPAVARLLGLCARLKLLVTSRAPLRVRGERESLVEPLAQPNLKRLPSLETLGQIPAIDLFVRRAEAIKPAFALIPENARAVAEICVRLDGLPLAIELAAARAKTLTPQAILERLDNRLRLLTSGPRDQPGRLQTLHAAIAWSYDLLDSVEQALFCRMAVFAGGCTLEAAESVCADTADDVVDGLDSLVNKSLLRQTETPEGNARFAMLESLRAFGIEHLDERGELADALDAHAHWCLDLAEEAESELSGADQAVWLARLETEHDNLRAAIAATATADTEGIGLGLVAALWSFWHVHGHLTEGRRHLDAALLASQALPTPHRLKALIGAGVLAFEQGDYQQATRRFEEGMELAQELSDQPAIAALLNNLGGVAHETGELDRAAELYEQSLAVCKKLNDRRRYANALGNLGAVAHYRGEEEVAEGRYEEALAIWRELQDANGVLHVLVNLVVLLALMPNRADRVRKLGDEALPLARVLGNKQAEALVLTGLGLAAETDGDLDEATELHKESLELFREIGAQSGIARGLGNLGLVLLDQGDIERADALCRESLALFSELGEEDHVAYALEGMAAIAAVTGCSADAARWIGAAEALRQGIGSTRPREATRRIERIMPMLRAQTSQEALAAGLEAGRALTPEQAWEEVRNWQRSNAESCQAVVPVR